MSALSPRKRPMPAAGPVVLPLVAGQPVGVCKHCERPLVLFLNEDTLEVGIGHLSIDVAVAPCTPWTRGGILIIGREQP